MTATTLPRPNAALSVSLDAHARAVSAERRSNRNLGLLLGGALAFLIYVLSHRGHVSATMAQGLVIAVLAALLVFTRRLGRRVHADSSAAAYPEVVRSFGRGFSFQPQGHMNLHPFRTTGAVPAHDRARFDSVVTGTADGAAFTLARAGLAVANGGFAVQRSFEGTVIGYSLPAPLSCRIVVRSLGGGGARVPRDLRAVDLGRGGVARRFQVFSDDPAAARGLVSPRFLDALDRLGKSAGGGLVQCGGAGTVLFVAIGGLNGKAETTVPSPDALAELIGRACRLVAPLGLSGPVPEEED